MSDLNEAGDSFENNGAIEDGADNGMEQMTDAEKEELFELIEGKNSDGTPIKKQFKKDELLKLAQKGFGADREFQEAKATKKQMQDLMRNLQDPEAWLELSRRLGHDPDKFAEERMAQKLLQAMKSPEEIEIEALRKESEQWKEFQKKQKAEQDEATALEAFERLQKGLYSTIEEVLNSGGIPKTTDTVAEVARYIQIQKNAAERRNEPFTLDQVKAPNIIAHMRKQHETRLSSLFDELDEDGVLAMLPEKLQKKIGAALTKKLSGGKVVDINTIERKPRQSSNPLELPERKSSNIDAKKARALAEAKVAKSQAEWDRIHGR